jgi:hypothetical protein
MFGRGGHNLLVGDLEIIQKLCRITHECLRRLTADIRPRRDHPRGGDVRLNPLQVATRFFMYRRRLVSIHRFLSRAIRSYCVSLRWNPTVIL